MVRISRLYFCGFGFFYGSGLFFYDFGNNGVGDIYYLDSVAFGGLVGGILGCTDPLASNYDPLATIDDGSCGYAEIDECYHKALADVGGDPTLHRTQHGPTIGCDATFVPWARGPSQAN